MKIDMTELMPLALWWVKQQRDIALKDGIYLTEEQKEDARNLGVQHPEKIAIMYVDEMPTPQDATLKKFANGVGLINDDTIGMALSYGLYIRSDYKDSKLRHLHEFVHVAQCEQRGLSQFIQDFFAEVLSIGYPVGPMEQEAEQKSQQHLESK